MVQKKRWYIRPLLYLLLVLLLFVFLFPFGVVVLNSFKPLNEIILDPLAAPIEAQPGNFARAWEVLSFPHALLNTTIITVVAVALLVLFTAMSSYWISRHDHGFMKVLEKVITGSALIPFSTIMLPLVLVVRKLGLINTYSSGIVTYVGIGFALAYLIMRGAAKGIPLDMDEAATIDGCNSVQTFFRIILPLMRPTIVTVIISDLFWVWNEFQIALIFLNTPKLQTIQLAINSMFGQYSTKWDIALPALLISIVPIVAAFLVLQKQVVGGIMSGAVKS